MRKPLDNEAVVCPASPTGRKVAPEQVYETTENGKRVTRGIIAKHRHWADKMSDTDCDWTGHVAPVIPKNTGPSDLIALMEKYFTDSEVFSLPQGAEVGWLSTRVRANPSDWRGVFGSQKPKD